MIEIAISNQLIPNLTRHRQ